MKVYVIRDWEEKFEISQSKRIPDGKPLSYVPMPTKHDGKGLRRLLRSEDALSMFGVWCLVVELAAKMPRRGVLADRDGPHDFEDVADSIGIDPEPVQKLLDLACSERINWIEFVEWNDEAHLPRMGGRRSDGAPSIAGEQADEKRGEEKREEDIIPLLHPPAGDVESKNPDLEGEPTPSRVDSGKKNSGGKWTKAKLAAAAYEDFPGFQKWWKSYPRKDGKRDAFEIWIKRGLEGQTPTMLAALAKKKTCRQWQEEEGRFIPHGSTYLNKRMEEDEPDGVGVSASGLGGRFTHG